MAVLSKWKLVNPTTTSATTTRIVGNAVLGTAILLYTWKVTYPLICGARTKTTTTTTTTTKIKSGEEDGELQKALEAEKLLIEKQQVEKIVGGGGGGGGNQEPALNRAFFTQLWKLVRIMIPRLLCHETALLGVHTICLISRTFLSIYVAALEGEIVKFIVRKDIRNFRAVLLKWFGIAIPATFINSMIRFLESKLALAFR